MPMLMAMLWSTPMALPLELLLDRVIDLQEAPCYNIEPLSQLFDVVLADCGNAMEVDDV